MKSLRLFLGCLIVLVASPALAVQTLFPAGTVLSPTNNYSWDLMTTINVDSGQYVPFVAYQFNTFGGTAGNYTFTMNTVGFGGAINIYTPQFDPTFPQANFYQNGVVTNNAGTISQTAYLQANGEFEVVFSAGLQGTGGTFSATVSGPANVTLMPVTNTTIRVQPQSQTILSGSIALLQVYAVGTLPHTFQWFRGSSPDTSSPIAGATASTYTTPSSNSYWVRVTGPGASGTQNSSTAVITVSGNPSAIYSGMLAPGGCTLQNGDLYTTQGFQIQSSGNYIFALSDARFALAIYQGSFDPLQPLANYYGNGNGFYVPGNYIAVISRASPGGSFQGAIGGGPAIVNLIPASPPQFISGPNDITIMTNTTATLAVGMTCGTPVNLQWYQGNSGDTSRPIAGATSSSCSTPLLFTNTSYWVRMTWAGGTNDSGAAMVYVVSGPITRSGFLDCYHRTFNRPAAAGVLSGMLCSYNFLKFTSPVTGPYTFSTVTSGTLANRSTMYGGGFDPNNPLVNLYALTNSSNPLTATLLANNTYYLVISSSTLDESGSYTTTVGGPGLITLQPVPTITSFLAPTQIISYAQSTNFLVNCPTPNVAYQWYSGVNCTRTAISGATSNAYTTPILTSDMDYWVEISNNQGFYLLSPRMSALIPPQVVNDTYNATEDTVLDAPSVLNNDFKADNVTLRVTSFTQPTHGTLVMQTTGSFSYLGATNFFGTDSFTYRMADDRLAALGTGTVTIVVAPVADTPSITPATTYEGFQTTNGLVISRNPADGQEVAFFQITAITNGTLFQNDGATIIPNGSFITFAQGNAGLKFLPTAGIYSPNAIFGFSIQASLSNSPSGLGGGIVSAVINVQPLPAVATTLPATNVTSFTATLNGSVTNGHDNTTYNFQYGPSAAYGSSTPVRPVNNALLFDGVSQSGQTWNLLSLSNISFTVEFWMRRDSSNRWDIAVNHAAVSLRQGLHIGFRPGNVFTFGFWGDDLDAPAAYSDNAWHHWACAYNITNNQRIIYRDGIGIATNNAGAPYLGNDLLRFARFAQLNTNMLGALDEVRVWSVARSQADIAAQMNANLSGTEAGLLGVWAMNEGIGTSAADSTPAANDASLFNAPLWISDRPFAEPIAGLTPGTLYHFRVVASNSIATSTGADLMFTTPPVLPVVTTLPAAGIASNSATLNGTVNPDGGTTTWYFQYGSTLGYGNTTPATVLRGGGALQFNGTNQMGMAGGMSLSNRSFSVEFWARRDGTNRWDIPVWQGTSSTRQGLHIGFRPENVFTFAFWGDDLNTPVAYTDNGWHHWACTYNITNNQRIIYRDGVGVATNITGGAYQGTGTLVIAHSGPLNSWLGGALDELRFWDGVRTPAQINANLTNEVAGGEPGLMGYWRFNDGSGAIASESSGLNTALTLTGSPAWIEGVPLITSTTVAPVNAPISGLLPGLIYHCRLVGSNSAGAAFGNDIAFTSPAAAPAVTTLAATGIGYTTATLNGAVNANGAVTTWYFENGLTAGYGNTTPLGQTPASGAILFNGTNQAGTVAGMTLSNRSFSVEFWARRDGSNKWDMIVGQAIGSNNNGLHIGFRDVNKFTFAFWGNDLDAPASLSDNAWHHWACTFNATNNQRIIYRDGVAAATNTASSAYQGSGTLYLGRMVPLGSWFGGAVDELRFWDGVRTPAQINATITTQLAGTEPGLLGYWRFDDGSGVTAADSSGRSTAMNLINAPTWIQGIPQAGLRPESAALTGLLPGTLYHFSLVGSNSAGLALGGDLTFTTLAAPSSQISGLAAVGNGAFQLNFTNISGAPFTVLAATNVATPFSQWTVLGPAVESSAGHYQFTDQDATNYPQRFYIIRSP